MAERRGLTADERMALLVRDRQRLCRERLLRQAAGSRWHRMVRVVPLFFELQGTLLVRRLLVPRDELIAALRGDAVLALDTAMRQIRGRGFLAGGDAHAYMTTRAPVDRLTESGLLEGEEYPDRLLQPAWSGPPRLFACVVETLPPHERLATGHLVVTRARLARELIGAVGQRPDLYALVD